MKMLQNNHFGKEADLFWTFDFDPF